MRSITPEEIIGQSVQKRAFELASGGDLSVLLVGPIGSSKTTLRRAFPEVRSEERESCTCGRRSMEECKCSPRLLFRWCRRLEKLARDFDIVLEGVPITAREILAPKPSAEKMEEMRGWREERVRRARKFGAENTSLELDSIGVRAAEMTLRRLHLTAGEWERVLRVARIIANFDAAKIISGKHVAEAVQYSPYVIDSMKRGCSGD